MIMMCYTILDNFALFLILMGVLSLLTTGKDDDFRLKTIHNKDSYWYRKIQPDVLFRKHFLFLFTMDLNI